jgi:hypothetical protein
MTHMEVAGGYVKQIWLFLSQTLSHMDTPTILKFSHYLPSLPMKMEQCSETSAYKIQTPGNYPEENTQHTEHGGSLKSRTLVWLTAL